MPVETFSGNDDDDDDDNNINLIVTITKIIMALKVKEQFKGSELDHLSKDNLLALFTSLITWFSLYRPLPKFGAFKKSYTKIC